MTLSISYLNGMAIKTIFMLEQRESTLLNLTKRLKPSVLPSSTLFVCLSVCLSVTVCPTPPRENGGWVVAQYVHGRWSTYQQLDRRPHTSCCLVLLAQSQSSTA